MKDRFQRAADVNTVQFVFMGGEFGWEQVPSYYPKMSAPCPIPIINHYLNLV